MVMSQMRMKVTVHLVFKRLQNFMHLISVNFQKVTKTHSYFCLLQSLIFYTYTTHTILSSLNLALAKSSAHFQKTSKMKHMPSL